MAVLTLASVQPANNIGPEVVKWFQAGAELAARGMDCFDLDLFIHDRKSVPDSRAAVTLLSGYYAQKRAQSLA